MDPHVSQKLGKKKIRPNRPIVPEVKTTDFVMPKATCPVVASRMGAKSQPYMKPNRRSLFRV